MRRVVARNLRKAATIVGLEKGLDEKGIKALYKRMKRRHTQKNRDFTPAKNTGTAVIHPDMKRDLLNGSSNISN